MSPIVKELCNNDAHRSPCHRAEQQTECVFAVQCDGRLCFSDPLVHRIVHSLIHTARQQRSQHRNIIGFIVIRNMGRGVCRCKRIFVEEQEITRLSSRTPRRSCIQRNSVVH